MAPTILIVPGFWVGPTPFSHVASLLQAQGYPTEVVTLPSTGSVSPGNPSMQDDIAAIRSTVTDLVEKGQQVVLVLHSAGGFLGSNAIEGLSLKARQAKQLRGGVSKIVFLSGAVFPEGFKHAPLPFFTYDVSTDPVPLRQSSPSREVRKIWRLKLRQGGAMHCLTPEKLLFNDLDEKTAKAWVEKLQSQPASDWDDTVTYCGWKGVPSVYLVCEGDACIPPPMQLQLAETAGSKIEKCAAGHMAMVSMPEKVVELIVEAAEA